MTHPFAKIFYSALKVSTEMDNQVLFEAEKFKDKGYSVNEIYQVLQNLRQGLIETNDIEIAEEALTEFSRYLE